MGAPTWQEEIGPFPELDPARDDWTVLARATQWYVDHLANAVRKLNGNIATTEGSIHREAAQLRMQASIRLQEMHGNANDAVGELVQEQRTAQARLAEAARNAETNFVQLDGLLVKAQQSCSAVAGATQQLGRQQEVLRQQVDNLIQQGAPAARLQPPRTSLATPNGSAAAPNSPDPGAAFLAAGGRASPGPAGSSGGPEGGGLGPPAGAHGGHPGGVPGS